MTPADGSRPPSSVDVAELAGVSRSTVSHILNGRGIERFPSETQDRVRAAAAALEYRPSLAGRSLVKGRSDTIVVLAPNTTWGGNLQDAVDRVVADTAGSRSNVIVRFAGPDRLATINAILDLQPMAVIDLGYLTETDRDRLGSKSIVTVPASHRSPDSEWAGLDRQIVGMQFDALLAAGDRRLVIASIDDDRIDLYGARRYELAKREATARGLDEPVFVRVPINLSAAGELLGDYFADGPVGFACYNDDVALAVLAAAREGGFSIPRRVGAVGVDATAIGQLWSPRLTTIRVDIASLMDLAIDELNSLLNLAPSTAPARRSRSEAVSLVPGESS